MNSYKNAKLKRPLRENIKYSSGFDSVDVFSRQKNQKKPKLEDCVVN